MFTNDRTNNDEFLFRCRKRSELAIFGIRHARSIHDDPDARMKFTFCNRHDFQRMTNRSKCRREIKFVLLRKTDSWCWEHFESPVTRQVDRSYTCMTKFSHRRYFKALQ